MPLESWKPQISQKAISVVHSFSDFHSDPRPIQADKAFIHFQKSQCLISHDPPSFQSIFSYIAQLHFFQGSLSEARPNYLFLYNPLPALLYATQWKVERVAS